MERKTIVSGGQVVSDIRAGMDDPGLMRKYQLSVQGLQSLFRKLIDVGLLSRADLDRRAQMSAQSQHSAAAAPPAKARSIDAQTAAKDIRAGMHDFDLMEKYGLSLRGLESLFDQLVASGMIQQSELDRRMPSFESTVDVTEEVRNFGTDPEADTPVELEEVIDLSWECPACGIYQSREYDRCPECGAIVVLLKRGRQNRT